MIPMNVLELRLKTLQVYVACATPVPLAPFVRTRTTRRCCRVSVFFLQSHAMELHSTNAQHREITDTPHAHPHTVVLLADTTISSAVFKALLLLHQSSERATKFAVEQLSPSSSV
jgi:hypothetical protein